MVGDALRGECPRANEALAGEEFLSLRRGAQQARLGIQDHLDRHLRKEL